MLTTLQVANLSLFLRLRHIKWICLLWHMFLRRRLILISTVNVGMLCNLRWHKHILGGTVERRSWQLRRLGVMKLSAGLSFVRPSMYPHPGTGCWVSITLCHLTVTTAHQPPPITLENECLCLFLRVSTFLSSSPPHPLINWLPPHSHSCRKWISVLWAHSAFRFYVGCCDPHVSHNTDRARRGWNQGDECASLVALTRCIFSST